jgi:hypothetical protein
MPSLPSASLDSLTAADRQRLEGLCRRVEEAWAAGERPWIEAYLAEVAAGLRPALLCRALAPEGAAGPDPSGHLPSIPGGVAGAPWHGLE